MLVIHLPGLVLSKIKSATVQAVICKQHFLLNLFYFLCKIYFHLGIFLKCTFIPFGFAEKTLPNWIDLSESMQERIFQSRSEKILQFNHHVCADKYEKYFFHLFSKKILEIYVCIDQVNRFFFLINLSEKYMELLAQLPNHQNE